jgi:hypothetical protein
MAERGMSRPVEDKTVEARIVPPTGAKGLNMAADVRLLRQKVFFLTPETARATDTVFGSLEHCHA